MSSGNMGAAIEIAGLRVRAFHGVGSQERLVGNDFEVSVSLDYPPALTAVQTDDVADTLNYADAIDIIKRVMSEPSALLEHVAERIRRALVEAYPAITGGRIVVSKIAPPVSAEIAAARFVLSFSSFPSGGHDTDHSISPVVTKGAAGKPKLSNKLASK